MNFKFYISLILFCICQDAICQETGSVDRSFNSIDIDNCSGIIDSYIDLNSSIFTSLVLPNNKILIGTNIHNYECNNIYGIARINSDGTYDNSFSSNVNGNIYTIALQNDGSILIGGEFTYCNGIARKNIARLLPDGQTDLTFNPGSGFGGQLYDPKINGRINKIKIQSDGKIVVGGQFFSYNGIKKVNTARLNSDGSLDSSFEFYYGFYGDDETFVNDIAIQPNGKIFIAGNLPGYKTIKRLNEDGTIDSTFQNSIYFSGNDLYISSIFIESNGDILLGGRFNVLDDSINYNHLIKVNSNGVLITNFFNTSGLIINGLSKIDKQSNGKILILNRLRDISNITNIYYGDLKRLNIDGTIDSTFNSNQPYIVISDFNVLSDDKIIVNGFVSSTFGINRMKLKKLNVDGLNDFNFNPVTGIHNSTSNTLDSPHINKIVEQQDGKLVIGGRFEVYNENKVNSLVRINVDGSFDTSFNVKISQKNEFGFEEIEDILIQNDGKIIIFGNFNLCNGVTRNSIARLNTDGSLDLSFNPGTGTIMGYSILSSDRIKLQSDGKIILALNGTTYNNVKRDGLIRINSDGSIDTTFNDQVLVWDDENYHRGFISIALQNNQKIIMSGSFKSVNGVPKYGVVRLNVDGTIDYSFDVGKGFYQGSWSDQVTINESRIALQSNGKMIIIGNLSYQDIYGRFKSIVRLNQNGSYDETFVASSIREGHYITIQKDDKIIIGDSSKNIRLNSDGSKEIEFKLGKAPGINNYIKNVCVKNNGKIIVGGFFEKINNIFRRGIVQLNGDNLLNIGSNYFRNATLYPNPVHDNLNIDLSDYSELIEINIFDLTGKRVLNENKIFNRIDFSKFDKGLYLLKILSNKGNLTKKIIKN